ncbi:MAG: DUF4214 domain-containing protein [Clostridiales bacterium]|nr:DUF4214 domain-containing protein [Clostridiales bacterium]
MKRRIISLITTLSLAFALVPASVVNATTDEAAVDSSEKISTVSVTVTPPAAGTVIESEDTKPSVTLSSDANYYISWTMYTSCLPSEGEYDDGSIYGTTVKAGEFYCFEVYLTPNGGYEFDAADNVTLTVNGAVAYELGYCSEYQYAFFVKVQAGSSSSGSQTTSSGSSSASSGGSSAPAPSPYNTPLEEFVGRSYATVLGRAFDDEGMAYWTGLLDNGATGADVVKGFLYSQEFLGRDLSDDYFVDVLYTEFFNRAPDAEGRAYWLDNLAAGMSRDQVIEGFINSEEWSGVCASYGIESGSTI